MTNYNPDKVKAELLSKIRKEKVKSRLNKRKKYFSYAAMLILICAFSVSYFMLDNQQDIEKSISDVDYSKEIKSDEIILKFEDGKERIIKTNEANKLKNGSGKVYGKQIKDTLYYNKVNDSEKLVFNELSVPFGKRFNLVLSDGTIVQLNSGTYIKYPVQFIEGHNREIVLKGEAYFDVAHSDTDKFIVKANNLDVMVLGTEFNVSFFPEDDEIEVVLVKGSVKIKNKSIRNVRNEWFLKSGCLASYNKEYEEMAINKTDVSLHTAWRKGDIRFKSTAFKNIIKKLERHFNQKIQNEYKYLDEQIYTASFYDGETIEEILSYFKEDIQFSFSKKNNKIIIKNPLTD